MKTISVLNVDQAIDLMKQGYRIRGANSRLLADMRQDKVRIVNGQMSARLSLQDFYEIYAREKFVVHQDQQMIDTQKDEEYYAWRREKQ